MDNPVTMILVPGLLGGAVVAALIFWLQRRGGTSGPVPSFRGDPLSTDVINMSSIKVAGIGGLGLAAMALAVALDIPRIGQTIAVGLGFGVLLATALIAWRRRSGPMPSSGERPGANTTLAIDAPKASPDPPAGRDSSVGPHDAKAVLWHQG